MNEWSPVWCVVNWTDAHRVEDGVHHEVGGVKHFDIHHARAYQAQLGAGWEIWHWTYANKPEEWVGVPSHPMNRNFERMPKPEGYAPTVPIPPDHDHDKYGASDA